MVNITAKIKCQAADVQAAGTAHEQVLLTFVPDYDDDRNKEWARFTPGLSLTMGVKPEVAELFEPGARYTLTFTPEES